MRPTFTLAAGLGALMLAAAATPAAAIDTIDCDHDRNTAERAICASEHLQILDARVTQAYADIMHDARVRDGVKYAVYKSQVDFLARRDQCGRDTECLSEVMERRATRIDFYR